MSDKILKLIQNFNSVIIQPILYLLATLSFAVFIWGLVEFIMKADSDEARTTGKQHMIWGLIGLFIMVSAIPIIRIALNTFGIDATPLQNAPSIPPRL